MKTSPEKSFGKIIVGLLMCLFAAILFDTSLKAAEPPVSKGEVIKLKEVPVQFDKEVGVSTAVLGKGRLHQIDATVIEIPPGGKQVAHRHLAEEMIYVVSGKGYTLMWEEAQGKKVRYDWAEGDLLSPSLNAAHQHFNASSQAPARLLSVTTLPLMESIFRNRSFLFSNDFSFGDRWTKAVTQKPEYVVGDPNFDVNRDNKAGLEYTAMNVGHILPNVKSRKMRDRGNGLGGITLYPDPEGTMAGNQLFEVVLRDIQNGSHTPAHRHMWEVVYVILKGKGYSIRQRQGESERKVEWSEGDMFIMDSMENHEHFPYPNSPPSDIPRMMQLKAPGYFGWSDIYGDRIGVDRKFLMQPKSSPTVPR